jgi:hypothetical protein
MLALTRTLRPSISKGRLAAFTVPRLALETLRQANSVEQSGQRITLGQVGQPLLLAPL